MPNTILGTSGNDNITGTLDDDFIYGFEGNDILSGAGGNDTLDGGAGNDTLDGGGAGNDTLIGGVGDDVYYVGDSGDVVIEFAGEGTLDQVLSALANYTLAANVEYLSLIASAPSNGTGNDLNNTIWGSAAANVIDGGLGADTLVGFGGNDTYILDNIGDQVFESAGQGIDTVNTPFSYTLGANLENLILTGTAAIDGTGNSLANALTGNSANNVLDGGLGADTMRGGAGDDTYMVDIAGDSVIENANEGIDTVKASINYTLGATLENLILTGIGNINGTGNGLANAITGNAGNNVLNGGLGADTMSGGAGNDSYTVDDAGDSVVENANEGTDTVNAGMSYTLGANIENLVLTGTALDGTGNELANAITGNAANNVLDGGLGADAMSGGAGDDTYMVDDFGDTAMESVAGGNDTAYASANWVMGENVENLVLTGSASSGIGNNSANSILGNALDNYLEGRGGADTLIGGLGNDIYSVSDAGDTVVEVAGEGTDIVWATATSYTLAANVENLTFYVAYSITGTGNALANTITGGTVNDLLDGGLGADTLIGGTGNDTYVVDDIGDSVVENANQGTDTVRASVNHTLGANVENLVLTGTAALDGTGNSLANMITGNSGSNILDGGAGDDSLSGGAGSDQLYGGDGNDTLIGGTGNDYMQGGTGADTILFGLGDGFDTVEFFPEDRLRLVGLNASDVQVTRRESSFKVHIASSGEEIEAIGSYGMEAWRGTLEFADGTTWGAAQLASAAYLGDYYYPNWADYLYGSEFGDQIFGLGGNDQIYGNDGADTLDGGADHDNLYGGQGDDVLLGGVGVDNLYGEDGNDTLIGGTGNDYMAGGAGADTILFGLGDGFDTAELFPEDRIRLVGLNASDVQVTRRESSFKVHVVSSGEEIEATGSYGMEAWRGTLEFADGTTWGAAQLAAVPYLGDYYFPNWGDYLYGSEYGDQIFGLGGNDQIYGNDGADYIDGGDGHDQLYGGQGDDALYGGAGFDWIEGGDGNDTLWGGAGEDSLIGGAGADTFLFGVGDGVDNASGFSAEDRVVLVGLNPGDVQFDRQGNSFRVTIAATGEQFYGLGGTTDAWRGTVEFADGTVWGAEQLAGVPYLGTNFNDFLIGSEFDDHIYGLGGNDRLEGNLGNDTLDGGAGGDQLYGGQGDDALYGGEGFDWIEGGDGNDTLWGGAGEDSLIGGAGADTFLFGVGDGVDNASGFSAEDRVVLVGLNPGDVQFDRQGGSFRVTIAATGEQFYGLGGTTDAWRGTVEFADGTVWGAEQLAGVPYYGTESSDILQGSEFGDRIYGLGGYDYVYGNEGDDTLDGGADNDVLHGGQGNDVLYGGTGSDSLFGDEGNDALVSDASGGNDNMAGGAGSDFYLFFRTSGHGTIFEGPGNAGDTDTVSFAPGIAVGDLSVSRSDSDLVIDIAGSTAQLKILQWFGTLPDTHVERFLFSGGAVLTDAQMEALINDPPAVAAPIADQAAQKNVAFSFAVPASTFSDPDGDVLAFSATLANGDPLPGWLTFDSSTATFSGMPPASAVGTVSVRVTATDGGGLSASDDFDIAVAAQGTVYGTEGDDVLFGTTGDDVLLGLGGNDQLNGNDGDDHIDGGAGSDLLFGGSGGDFLSGGAGVDYMGGDEGDDVLWGGAADDFMDSGVGADTFLFGVGDGNDTSGTYSSEDRIRLLGLNTGDVVVTRGQTSLTVTIASTGERFLADGGYWTGTDGWRSHLEFADGTVWGPEQLATVAFMGTEFNDVLSGSEYDDNIYGLGGNDQIQGNDGADHIDGGAGSDYLLGGSGGDFLSGGAGIDYMGGDEGDDVLWGGAGDDFMDSGVGADTFLFGVGDGSDISYTYSSEDRIRLLGLNTGDVVVTRGQTSLTVTIASTGEQFRADGGYWTGTDGWRSHLEFADGTVWGPEQLATVAFMGTEFDDVLSGSEYGDNIYGLGGNDALSGNSGDDTLDGGVGADLMYGGGGNDTYYASSGDTVIEQSGDGYDRVLASSSYVLQDNVEALELIGSGAPIDGTGNSLDNAIFGTSEANVLDGGAGADLLFGLAGNDTYVVDDIGDHAVENAGEGSDTVRSSVDYTLEANLEALVLMGTATHGTGNELDNIIIGNALGNTLNGGAGIDTLIGGAGDDWYFIDAGDVVVEAAGGGYDSVVIASTHTMAAEVEQLFLAGSAAIDGTGNALDNRLYGTGAANVLDGGAGADVMSGFTGDDTYYVDNGLDQILENAGEGMDTVYSSVSRMLEANVEKLVLTGSAVAGTGNALANVITGNAADNVLDGGGGVDTLIGGLGNDEYWVDDSNDSVLEVAGQGVDTVHATATYALSADVENLTLEGTAAINGIGNALNNVLRGNSAANVLSGDLGDDTYYVGAGDTVLEATGQGIDTVFADVNWTLSNNVENLVLTGSGAITGTGNGLANAITGNAGDNTLDGGAGNDTMAGGLGNDTYMVGTPGDLVTEQVGEGTDTVISSISYTLGQDVENLTLATGAVTGTGNGLDNVITGNSAANTLNGAAGNDTLNGGTGADVMNGGTGDDVYFVDNSSDQTNESAGQGIDAVNSSITRTLATNLEHLILTGTSAINGTGNGSANLIRGNSNTNTLNGAAGFDALEGGGGNDTLSDTSGGNYYNGGSGTDSLTGSSAGDFLIGGTGNDTLSAGGGRDVIAFNFGDGQDSYSASSGVDNTVSLGGAGLTYEMLTFQRSGNNLILNVSASDRITFNSWYSSSSNRNVLNLQVIAEAMADFDAGSSNVLLNQKVQTFNFQSLVSAFNASGQTTWALTNALMQQHLGSNTDALGGDLAYYYGRDGSVAGIGFEKAQDVVASSQFGNQAQTIRSQSELQTGPMRLG